MSRRWYNEDYRKLYTRQEGPWLTLPACARALASDLVRYADDKGVVAVVEQHETDAQAIAGVVRAKADEAAWVERAVTALMDDRYLVRQGRRIVIRNYVAAQERLSQDAIRKRRQRDKQSRDADEGADNGVTSGGTEQRTPMGQAAGQQRDMERDSGVTRTVTENVTVTPDVTANVTPLSAVSRRDETRREKPLAGAGDAQARGSQAWTGADLELLWVDTYKIAAGNPGDVLDLARLLRTTADARREDHAVFADRFLVAFREMLADWKARKVHHGDPEMIGAIEHFAKVIGWIDRAKPDNVAPGLDVPRQLRERAARVAAEGPVGAEALRILAEQRAKGMASA